MTRVLAMLAMAMVLASSHAIAVDAPVQSTGSKRQLTVQVSNCMKKRMAVDKEISYIAAAKVCKNQVNDQRNALEAVAVATSNSAAKP